MVGFTTLVIDHSQSREETRETGQMWSILFVTSFLVQDRIHSPTGHDVRNTH